MGIQAKIAFFCIINLFWIQPILCDDVSTKSDTSVWTCICSLAHQENSSYIPANCSSSCDCTRRENRWKCLCPVDGLPKLASVNNASSCFTGCNCNAGIFTESQPSKSPISRNIVAALVILCLVLTLLALIGSMLWYFYRKDTHSIQRTFFVPDRQTSFSSAAALISRQGSSISLSKGFIPKTSLMFRSRTGGAFHGSIIHFSYSELETATNRFCEANLIGVGGSSRVFRGVLRDGRIAAIKRMKIQVDTDVEHVFLTEIELISKLHHCHVVPLLGYCLEHQGKRAERLLVFEYIPNGNLRECLDGNPRKSLEWNTRISIALGAARGLEYLHEAAAPKILHRDVKSTNILLDENWRAMITDLGMAKHLQNDGVASCSSSPARMQGTFGYFAPEYAIVGRASLKSDVFSFGVVLLELITGRKPIHKSSNKGEESLVIWATPRLQDHKRVILELPDPRLKGAFQEEEMQVMAYLAKECLLLDPESRPTMSEVVQILSTIAPEKSKRKNIPSLLSYRKTDISAGDDALEAEEIKQMTSEKPARGAWSSNADTDSYISENETTAETSSDIEKLMLMTSKSRSWRFQGDETVDLTEPRLESFCLPSVDSRILKIS